jgi:CPA1 family monovalent cation:H+ antiporter
MRALPNHREKKASSRPQRRARHVARNHHQSSGCVFTDLREAKITDETRRRIERDLDLEEAAVDNREKNRQQRAAMFSVMSGGAIPPQ